MKRFLLPVLIVASMLSSCTEDPTVTEMLTDSDWRMKTLTIDPAIIVDNVAITNYYSQLYDYDKDNVLRFKDDGTFITDEGALKENSSDPQTKQGSWLLSVEEDKISVWLQEDSVVYNLLEITEEQMTLSYAHRDTATQINYTLTAGFGH